jgi:addiction module HigA family antidote
MDKAKKARLTKKGWKFGSAESFLRLTPEESGADATRTWPDVAIPPGDVLAEELKARGLTQSRLAQLMRRPLQAINEIVRGRRRITGATALGLADALGTSAEFWIRLEADYELNKARLARRRELRREARLRGAL